MKFTIICIALSGAAIIVVAERYEAAVSDSGYS